MVDQASLYGLTGDTLCDDNKENIRKPTARRKSGIPNKKVGFLFNSTFRDSKLLVRETYYRPSQIPMVEFFMRKWLAAKSCFTILVIGLHHRCLTSS